MKHKFQLLSDLHLEAGTYFSINPKAKYLLLAGDIGYPQSRIYQDFMRQVSKKFEKVFYTSGNHEYYQSAKSEHKSMKDIDNIIREVCGQYENVYYLQNNYYDFDDLRIVGTTLWTDVSNVHTDTNDYSMIYTEADKLITANDVICMYNKNKEYLENIIASSDKPLLIMTHHLPSYDMISEVYKEPPYIPCYPHYASHLDHLFRYPVTTWVCGHSHGFVRQLINDIPCIINAVGYPSEPRKGASTTFTFGC